MLSLSQIEQLKPIEVYNLLQKLNDFQVQQEQEREYVIASDVQMLGYLMHISVQLAFLKSAYDHQCGPGAADNHLKAHRKLIDDHFEMMMADDDQFERRIGYPEVPKTEKAA